MNEEKIDLVEFDDSIIPQILDLYGNEIDSETGKIIDKKSGEIIIDPYTEEELTLSNLGGILPGSKIFISKSAVSIAEYITEYL